jgi:hypothetical protein
MAVSASIITGPGLGDVSPGKSLMSCAENYLINQNLGYFNRFSLQIQSAKENKSITLLIFFVTAPSLPSQGRENALVIISWKLI